MAVKHSTNSTLLANVTTMDSPPGISDTYSVERTQIASTRVKHNHEIVSHSDDYINRMAIMAVLGYRFGALQFASRSWLRKM
eukprot:COSAG02_NODE_8718_length_2463_cov_1.673435_2_plen_82_part_00